MDRLTYWNSKEKGSALPISINDDGDCVDLETLCAKLAAYEDTGLKPEECAEYKKFEDEAIAKGVTFQKIVELMNLARTNNQWISVEDRLPEAGNDVLMCFTKDSKLVNMAVGFYWIEQDGYGWCAYTTLGFYTDCDDAPTHWMPLPEPPRED